MNVDSSMCASSGQAATPGEKAASAYRKGATTGFARRDTGSAHAGLWCGLSRMRRKSHVRF
jgi:hypothetical protein